MYNRGVLLFAAAAILCSTSLHAQDYAVEIQPDKKIINIGKIGLPENTSLYNLLKMLPEFTNRDGDALIDGFDVQIDGKSTGESRDVILTNMKLYEIKKIEVSDSPTAAQQRNGQAGVLNIVPVDKKEGLEGSVRTFVSSSLDISPDVVLNYKKNKMELYGYFGMEYYRNTSSNLYDKTAPDYYVLGTDKLLRSFCQETARIDLKFTPSKKNEFRLWVWESCSAGRDVKTESFSFLRNRPDLDDMGQSGGVIRELTDTVRTSTLSERIQSFTAMAEYKHIFSRGSKFIVSTDYSVGNRVNAVCPQSSSTEIKFEIPDSRRFSLKAGANGSLKINDITYDDNRTIYLSPFAEFRVRTEKFKLNAGARYQYYSRFGQGSHDITANVNALWQITGHDAVRLMANRYITRPSFDKVYPNLTFDVASGKYVKGNPSLGQTTMHTLDLGYIFDRQVNGWSFVTNFSIGYNRVDNLPEECVVLDEDKRIFYTTFQGSGVNNIFNAKLNAIMQVGILTLSLTGNVFHNAVSLKKGGGRFNAYNLSAVGVLRFRGNWTLDVHSIYNGKVRRMDDVLGDCLFTSVSVNKTIGKWTLNFHLSDVFDYYTSSEERKGDVIMTSLIDLYTRSIGAGFTYRF